MSRQKNYDKYSKNIKSFSSFFFKLFKFMQNEVVNVGVQVVGHLVWYM